MVSENSYVLKKFHPEILREYDIRGIVDKNLDINTAYSLGRAFGHLIYINHHNKKIAVGYDGRLTSPKLHEALCVGLIESGINTFSIGICPTPMAYFSHYFLNTDAVIMITGSHNPPEYNGFKMVLDKKSFYAENIKNLQSLIESNSIKKRKGSLNNVDVISHYVDRNLRNINLSKKMKIAWDIGNGAVGTVIDKFIEKLDKAEHIVINKEVDGTFPNHHPDPTVPKNMEQLIDTVKKNSCDIGIAFDGDGDRLGVIDNKGSIVWPDQYMLLLSNEISKLYQNPKIIMDVKSSKVFFDEIKKIGCEPLMYRTGHSPIKEKMKEIKSPLSGEMSGHVCYSDDFYGYDDAIYVGLRLLRILSKESSSLNQLISQYPKTFSTPEIRIDVDEARKFKIIDEIKYRLQNSEKDIIDIDGIRVQKNNGWFLIRASNTQNQLTCRVEATSQEDLNYLIEFLKKELKKSQVEIQFNL